MQQFQVKIWKFYEEQGRHDLPWRQVEAGGRLDPYAVLVSEIMLQQTQVGRVVPKFKAFIQRFPTVQALAAAPLSEVLKAWNGLGYNRRAKFLWQAARTIEEQDGELPTEVSELQKLPGIGANTAGAIAAYVYNQPAVFIETNIRTVFLHHFFAEQQGVSDRDVATVVAETLDYQRPREWYWALMDYGTHLKQTVGNVARASQRYAKQSKFEGSVRQIRGQVIRLLAAQPHTAAELATQITDSRLPAVLKTLTQERLIQKPDRHYRLAER